MLLHLSACASGALVYTLIDISLSVVWMIDLDDDLEEGGWYDDLEDDLENDLDADIEHAKRGRLIRGFSVEDLL